MKYCIYEVKTEDVFVDGSELILQVPEYDYDFGREYKLIICQAIPTDAGIYQVKIRRGHTDIDFRTRTGNYVRADQIKSRRAYPVIAGNDPLHVSMLCLIPESCYAVAYPNGSKFSITPVDETAAAVK